MNFFEFKIFLFIFLIFAKNLIAQMPGIENPLSDFPEGDIDFTEEIEQTLPIAEVDGQIPVPGPDFLPEQVPPTSFPMPIGSQPEVIAEEQQFIEPVPIETNPIMPPPTPGPLPIEQQIPSQPVAAPPMYGQPVQMPISPDSSMMGQQPQPVQPVSIQAVPKITETQNPLIDAGPDKQKSLTETTGALIKTPKAAELQNILDQADQVMKRIKNSLDLIEDLRKNLQDQFNNIDNQLDVSYQNLGFERGRQFKILEKKEKELSRAIAQ